MGHATRESQYVNNINEPRRKQEDDFADIISRKLYKINIGVYAPHGERKVEVFETVADIDKDRKDVRILIWENARVEHWALNKNIETLIDRPNKMNHKF